MVAGTADEISYSSAMKACEEGQRWALALYFLDELDNRTGPVTHSVVGSWRPCSFCWVSARSMQIDVITYSSCISACDKGAQWQSALQLLRMMPVRHLQVDAISHSAVISACEKSSEWKQSLELLCCGRGGRAASESCEAQLRKQVAVGQNP
eukprot:Skav217316  [mRNA]  locus=scaffold3163:245509:246881:+ [translate_table: standard]